MDCKIPAYLWSNSLGTGPRSKILINDEFLHRIEANCQKDSDKEFLGKLANQYNSAIGTEYAAFRNKNEDNWKIKQTYEDVLERVEQHCNKIVINFSLL